MKDFRLVVDETGNTHILNIQHIADICEIRDTGIHKIQLSTNDTISVKKEEAEKLISSFGITSLV